MKTEHVLQHFGTWTKAMRELGYSVNAYRKWIKADKIPISAQLRIEKLTKGKLKCDFQIVKTSYGKVLVENKENQGAVNG